MKIIFAAALGFVFSLPLTSFAKIKVEMHFLNSDGKKVNVGHIEASDTKYGLEFKPYLKNLPSGLHGFHVHQNPSCEPSTKDGKVIQAGSAGGHYDPKDAKSHGSPWGDGHLGDLPPLFVDMKGDATSPVLAPRLTEKDIKGRALMLHAGGDNHSDTPKKLGGGGARIVCGVIK
jgi:superoxide dismutase, Cu-Zn family